MASDEQEDTSVEGALGYCRKRPWRIMSAQEIQASQYGLAGGTPSCPQSHGKREQTQLITRSEITCHCAVCAGLHRVPLQPCAGANLSCTLDAISCIKL